MKIKILTLFPEMYDGFLNTSIVGRILNNNIATIELIDIRQYSNDKHHHVDDTPYGGGAGMLMKVDVLNRALQANKNTNSYTLLTSPKAMPLKQKDLVRLSLKEEIIIVCGHYEGIDSRFEDYVDEKVSIGDYILTGGELVSMVICDGVLRLLDKAINDESLIDESYNNNLLEYPQYTRPYEYDGKTVPFVLTNGNHKDIKEYNLKMALYETIKYRSDLLKDYHFTKEEIKALESLCNDLKK